MNYSRLVLTTLVAACALGEGECWFWQKKPTAEKPKSNNDILYEALRAVINDLLNTIRHAIMMRTVELIILLALCITLFIGIRWLYKGRPIYGESNPKHVQEEKNSTPGNKWNTVQQPANCSTTTLNLYSPRHIKDRMESTSNWEYGHNVLLLNGQGALNNHG